VGWAALSKGSALEPITYPVPELGPRDARVAVSHCGVCYTDIQAIDDFYGITDFPFVPGHEIVGSVEAVGEQVSDLRPGDRVGIGWQGGSCGRCEWCVRGEEQLCREIADAGTWQRHGGFADSVTVDSRFAYPLPATLSSEIAAVLMCAGASVFAPLRRHAGEASGKVAIYGVGGLGHLAIQFAHALGLEVTAFSSSPSKEQDALALGADRFVVVGDRARMRPFDCAFDVVLCTAHGAFDWEELMDIVVKRGRLVVVGFPDVSLDPTDLVAHELAITGSFLGSRETVREMLSFAAAHDITPRIERLPMSSVKEAIARLKANRVRYRMLLDRA
jgi:uncharacterized zinc-type alcohol dehydrogenase-like protein